MKSRKPAQPSADASEARRGRPRAFDVDAALDAAVRVFWRHGYEGTSLPDLEAAMGINRPSLYAAFGNKEALFRKAVDRYVAQREAALRQALSQPTVRQSIDAMLTSGLAGCDNDQTRGCMLVQGALACGEASKSIQQELTKRRCAIEDVLRERIERGLVDGDLPATTDARALAKYVAMVQNGLAVQSASGATRQQLLAAIQIALTAIPDLTANK